MAILSAAMERLWPARFRHPTIDQVTWAAAAPDRVAAVTTEDGSTQAWAWDLGSGERRLVSRGGVGAEEVHMLPDGSGAVWWIDELGDERGRWMRTPFEGGGSEPLIPDAIEGWAMGISLVERGVGVGLSTDEDYRVLVSIDGGPAREVYRSKEAAGIGREWPQGGGGLSQDASLVCIRHSEHGDINRQALRVFDTRSGETVGDQVDEGRRLEPVAWAPAGVGHRLVITSELTGIERPGVWDLDRDERVDVELPALDGPVIPLGWAPDGRVLAHHDPGEGTNRLLAVDPRSGEADEVVVVRGTINDAAYRPDGALWIRSDSSVDPPAVRDADGATILALSEDPLPPGTRSRWTSWRNPAGDTIHGFLTAPPGAGPFPLIASIHGGPEWHHTDLWDPAVQAFVDEGFAVLQANYRGSTGRGTAFRETLRGNIGFPEAEDVVAGVDHAIDTGVADPGALFLEGWSWGGYLTTLLAGLHPDRWRAACAGIPVGDYVAAHYESAPALRAWDLAVLGGSPMDLPELYQERNPITYVERVRAPMLLIAGEHDSRCPLGQVMVYAHALRARDREVDVHLYPEGHHAMKVEDRIAHTRMTIDFFRRHLSDGATS
ncbi:MAG TPA: prolyl oligopeptidase family serine peptidase [Actinomycetota bacterium]|nr:prolyl oligopeptidase family serine peptidase [Actinomycetota bacterium]